MILLRKPGVLFLKTRKTAGTSLEIALSAHAGPEDIVTPISPVDELLRLDAGYQFPVNYCHNPEAPAAYRRFLMHHRQSLDYTSSYRHPNLAYYNHMPWLEIVGHHVAVLPRDLLRVTIIRHPYEVAVSLAAFKARQNPKMTFDEQLDRVCGDPRLDNSRIYRDVDGALPEFVLRYEHLAEDLETLKSGTGLELRSKLPNAKSGLRADRPAAAALLSTQQKNWIQQHCAFEFERFGYAV